jgi:hypothetical protein
MDLIILAHGDSGGMDGSMSGLVGLGPVILGAVLIGYFILLLGGDRRPRRRQQDDSPSPARQMFDGKYEWSAMMLGADIDAHFSSIEKSELMEPTSPKQGG